MRLLPLRKKAVLLPTGDPNDVNGHLGANKASSSQTANPLRGGPRQRGVPQRTQSHGSLTDGFTQSRKVTVSLDGDVVRVVVLQGRRVISWATASAEQHPENGHAGDPAGGRYSECLRHLWKQLKIRGGRVVIDLPFQAPLIRYLHLPKMPKRYVNQSVVPEVAETIPFAIDEMDVSWQVYKNGTGSDVFAVAVAKRDVDTQVKLIKEANISPRAAYSKAVALCHASGLTDGIVAHVGSSQAALLLIRHGVPRVMHQVNLPEKFAPVEELAERVSRAVEELAGYAETIGIGEEARPLPVMLTGQVSRESPLTELFSAEQQRGLVTLTPPMIYPEHFNIDEYSINLGLALADAGRGKARAKAARNEMPSVNLLQARHLPRPLPLRPIAVFVALLLFGAVALSAQGRVDSLSLEVATLSARVESLKGQEREQRLATGHAKAVEEETRGLAQRTEALKAYLAQTEAGNTTLLSQLETFTERALPPNVLLSSLSPQSGGFALIGHGSSHEAIRQYITNLRKSGLFKDVRLIEVTDSRAGPDSVSPQQQGTAVVSFRANALLESEPDKTLSAPPSK